MACNCIKTHPSIYWTIIKYLKQVYVPVGIKRITTDLFCFYSNHYQAFITFYLLIIHPVSRLKKFQHFYQGFWISFYYSIYHTIKKLFILGVSILRRSSRMGTITLSVVLSQMNTFSVFFPLALFSKILLSWPFLSYTQAKCSFLWFLTWIPF